MNEPSEMAVLTQRLIVLLIAMTVVITLAFYEIDELEYEIAKARRALMKAKLDADVAKSALEELQNAREVNVNVQATDDGRIDPEDTSGPRA
jgi:hypothetical protein